jgi:hypothetical protein
MDQLLWGQDACLSTTLPEDYLRQADNYQKLGDFSSSFPLKEWIKIVFLNPIPYIEHRLSVGGNLLGISNPPTGIFLKNSAPTSASIKVDPNFNNYLHTALFQILEGHRWIGVFFLPVIWLLGLILLMMKTRSPARKIVLISAIFYTLVAVIVSPGTDLRYMYPIYALMIVGASHYFANPATKK